MAGYFAAFGIVFLILCVFGVVCAISETQTLVSFGIAVGLVGTGVFNYFLWRAVHFVLHLLADIEENTRS